MSRGRFITLEGIDGAGKSTHLDGLVAALRARGKTVVATREPGGTELGERLRALLLGQPMHLETEALLMFAARREHLDKVILPALEKGTWVVSDRFTDASFAYQGAGRGFDLGVLGTLEGWVQQGLQPDTTVWFDLPPRMAAQRRAAVRVPDRFEQQDEAFFERVRQGYLARCEAHPERFVRIDASQTREAVWAQIVGHMAQRGWS